MKHLRRFRFKMQLGRRGFSLPVVLGITGLCIGLVLGYFATTRSEQGSMKSYYNGTKAGYFAECGARAAIGKLTYNIDSFRDLSNSQAGTTINDASGNYSVHCSNPLYPSDMSRRVIVATGSGGGGLTRSLTVEPISIQTGIGNYALFTVGGVTLSGSSSVSGSVGTNGIITLNGTSSITGNAGASSFTGSGTVTGIKTTGYNCSGLAAMKPGESSSVSVLTRSTYSSASPPPGATLSGSDYSYDYQSRVLADGTYYCPGKLNFSTSGTLTCAGTVTIYAVGDVALTNGGRLGKADGTGGKFLIISEGNISIIGDAKAYNVIVIAGGTLTISNSAVLIGSGLSFSTSASTISGAGFTYDKTTFDAFPAVESGLSVTPLAGGTSVGTITIGGYHY